ncbi:hypothetical protein GCM10009839_16670 [Catenulispora yoronensis]|uniref:Uncharacterized protein n=1 Tax=Catenulispora yoronensis TaxID=450799 RepID=A0ABP5FB96_9ACTN
MGLTSLRLTGGRSIDLISIEASRTYGGFLEGFPTAEINDHSLKRLREHLAHRYSHMGVHIIDPPRKIVSPARGPRDEPEELLPPIKCIGVFHSSPIDPARDDGFGISMLVIAWFQFELDLPFAAAARADLAAVAWDELARDGDL